MSKRINVWKLTDRDDPASGPEYYTTKKLRDYVLNDMYDAWGKDHFPSEQSHTKEQIAEDDGNLLDYLNEWGFNLECIAIITEEDFN